MTGEVHAGTRAVISTCLAAGALILALLSGWQAQVPPVADRGSANMLRDYGELPLTFEANAGRTDSRFDFLNHGRGYSLGLGASGASIQLAGSKRRQETLDIGLLGAADPAAVPAERLPGVVNSFVGNDPAKWQTAIPTYGRVRYPGVYPGIDVEWYGNQGKLEHDFIVEANADPGAIGVRFGGADSVRVAGNGDLLIDVGRRQIRQRAPVAYQQLPGGRHEIPASYEIDGPEVSFRLGAYDRSRTLVIDPQVLLFSSYLGGSSDDEPEVIAVDGDGAAYVSGLTISSDFPTQAPIPCPTCSPPSTDLFVTKIDSSGNLAYSTLIGGSGFEAVLGGSLSFGGEVAISGSTNSPDFPTSANAYSSTPGLGNDAYVTKLSADGTALAYSTYFGGGGNDSGEDVDFGFSSTKLFLAGTTQGVVPTNGAVSPYSVINSGFSDTFLTVLDTSQVPASQLSYSTMLGGGGSDNANDLTVDGNENAYLTGFVSSTDFPMVNAAKATNGAGFDAFVSKINPAVGGVPGLLYSTYLGADGNDDFGDEVLDDPAAPGRVWVTGTSTNSATDTFPTTTGAFDEDANGSIGSTDAFLSRLETTLSGSASLSYSTLLGGTAFDSAGGLALDGVGGVYVAGSSDSDDFPTRPGAYASSRAGATDAYVSRFDPQGAGAADLTHSTYLGGSASEQVNSLALDGRANAYVTGFTLSSDFPLAGPFQGSFGGGTKDGFVSKVRFAPFIDGSPLNISVTTDGRLDISIDGEAESEVDFDGGDPKAGLQLNYNVGAPYSFGPFGAGYEPVELPVLSGTGTPGDPYVLRTVYKVTNPLVPDLQITETQTYVNGQYGVSSQYVIENTEAGVVTPTAILTSDLNIDGDDTGVGLLDPAAPRFLGSLTDPYQTGDGLLEQTPWDGFQEGDWGSVAGLFNSFGPPSPSNSTVPGIHDTAVAALWNRSFASSGMTGDTHTVQARWQFRHVPPPIYGQKVDVRRVSGTVLVKAPGQADFYNLTDDRRIPIGSLIDARNGFVGLSAENANGVDETIVFWDGLFEVQQQPGARQGASGPLTARLAEDLNCNGRTGRKSKKKKKKRGKGRLAQTSASPSRRLWAKGKGSFRTTGYRGSATIRGTEWLTEDRCVGKKQRTTFRVVEGLLEIDDFGKRGGVNKLLGGGKQYVAGKPKAKKKKKKKK